ncbi:MAG: hypothetical protein ABI325_00385 [Ginsengibacter sp.]
MLKNVYRNIGRRARGAGVYLVTQVNLRLVIMINPNIRRGKTLEEKKLCAIAAKVRDASLDLKIDHISDAPPDGKLYLCIEILCNPALKRSFITARLD